MCFWPSFIPVENYFLTLIIDSIIWMKMLSRRGHLKKKQYPPSPVREVMGSLVVRHLTAVLGFPLQCSSGLWGTITGISSRVCPSAPAGRASSCLWCGTQWPRPGCTFCVRAGVTSATTGTGRLTGARETIPVTWQTSLSLMEVRSWEVCPWACACRCGGLTKIGEFWWVWCFGGLVYFYFVFCSDWIGMPLVGACTLLRTIVLRHPCCCPPPLHL